MSNTVAQCPRFVQNAWKKDLCSNCFKSKEEHAAVQQTVKFVPTKPIKIPPPPAKSIIKASKKSSKKKSVNFPKEVSEVIGYGGEWSGSEGSDHDDDVTDTPPAKEVVYEDDEHLQKLTKTNTEFNMNNGNLLGDPTSNIKKSFAALKLGAPQKDSAGKKQTLKISVTPFSGGAAPTKLKIAGKDDKSNGGVVLKSIISTSDENFTKSKPIEEPEKSSEFEVKISNEKSLLEEISETLLSKRIVVNEAAETSSKVETGKSSTEIQKSSTEPQKNFIEPEKSSNEQLKSSSKFENSKNFESSKNFEVSKSFEVSKPSIESLVKTSYEISKSSLKLETPSTPPPTKTDVIKVEIKNQDSVTSAVISSSSTEATAAAGKRAITRGNAILKDMEKPKIQVFAKTPESDNGSDFECSGTSDYYDVVDHYENPEEESSDTLLKKKSHFFSNQTVSDMFLAHQPINEAIKKRGESYNLMDTTFVSSKITNDGLIVTKSHHHEDALDSTGSSFDSSSSSDEENSKPKTQSSNSSDYEDIQVIDKALKSRCEPDGRSDPDGSSETSPAPALPQNPPPQQSFLHSTKPKVPTKPVTVNVVKPFQKRNAEIIMQLQQVINKEKSLSTDTLDVLKSPKKTRAPEPPENDLAKNFGEDEPIMSFKEIAQVKNKFAVKTNTVQFKEPRSYPAINPKFRSLNHLNKSQEAQEKLEKFEKLQSPEPAPRHSLSLSQDSLNMDMEKAKKKKFSIKKFLRMGNNKTEQAVKKEYSHYADIPTSPSDYCAPQVKPRLIIIHPLDINNTGVEVVSSASPEIEKFATVTHKPPAPPIRADTTKLEINKPSRPPPPKSNELRVELEQQIQKAKAPSPPSDNVYANLGEIRNSIAPRKPERTASMREREAKALELQRRQPVGETDDEQYKSEDSIIAKPTLVSVTPDSFTERKKKLLEIENISTRSKIELFESGSVSKSPSPVKQTSTYFVNNDGLKSSVQKMNVTIDNYLKNKKLISASDTNLLNNASRSPTPPQIVASTSQEMPRNYLIRNSAGNVSNIELRTNGSYEPITVNGSGKMQQRASYPEHVIYSSAIVPRATATMSYCGSEIGESEIYSPYSFCGSEAGDLAQGDPNDGYQTTSRGNKTVSRLRMRKGRSVVHTNLEDNYSAVIVANHEALAQVLEQLQQPPMIPTPLRPVANSLNLRFDDFMIIDSIGLVVGKSVFHQAIWQNSVHVTLVLTSDSNQMVSGVCSELNQMSGGVSGALKLITEFCDLVPNNYLPSMPTTKVQMVQATITVLPKIHVETLEAMGAMIKSKAQNQSLFGGSMVGLNNSNSSEDDQMPPKNGLFDDLLCREVGFIMLQLVNGLKMMQAKGVEDMPLSLSNVIMCRELEKETQARLCILQGVNSDVSSDDEDEMATLCQCALKVLKEFLPETKLTQILAQLLAQERSDTLTKTKSVLEYVLWGPADVAINGPIREREVTLQRWLDLSRATALRSLAGSKIDLTIYDECHLIFLIRSNSKTMLEASQIIAANVNNATS